MNALVKSNLKSNIVIHSKKQWMQCNKAKQKTIFNNNKMFNTSVSSNNITPKKHKMCKKKQFKAIEIITI